MLVKFYSANHKEPFLYSSSTSMRLCWTVEVPETSAGLTLSSLLLGWTPAPFFSNKRTKATYSHESVAPPLMWNPLNSCGTFLRPLSELLWTAAHQDIFFLTCSEAFTCNTQAYSIHAKENQSSISLSCDSRGQYTLINEFHYYAYVFIFLMMDLGKKKPCIFCDRAVRHHQAIKNNTSHAYLYSTLNNISKYCLYRLITKSACGTQTGSSETCQQANLTNCKTCT